MLPSDVVADIEAKKPYYKKIAELSPFMSEIGKMEYHSMVGFTSDIIWEGLVQLIYRGKVPKLNYRLDHFEPINKFWELWNSLDLNGTYIYRGTSANYISGDVNDIVYGGCLVRCINCNCKRVSNWSYYPIPALYFASRTKNPVVLVMKYDPERCTKVNYYPLRAEVNGLVNGKLVAYGGLVASWEAEVRCYEVRYSQVVYKLFGTDLIDLLNYSYDVARNLLDYESLLKLLSGG